MFEHEYSLVGGINRTKIGRYLTLLSAAISAGVVFAVLSAVDIANRLGIQGNLPPSVLSSVSAGAVFVVLYTIFDKWAWKWRLVNFLVRVPDLSGEWHCDGQTINPDGTPSYKWEGKVVIVQRWDKIRVRLTTSQSGSNSINAGLICDDVDGFKLIYNYRNDPKINETQLRAHYGFATVIFAKDRKTAQGEYFNGHGRFTFGKLALTKV